MEIFHFLHVSLTTVTPSFRASVRSSPLQSCAQSHHPTQKALSRSFFQPQCPISLFVCSQRPHIPVMSSASFLPLPHLPLSSHCRAAKTTSTTHLDLNPIPPTLPSTICPTILTCPVCALPETHYLPALAGKAARTVTSTLTPAPAHACKHCSNIFRQESELQRRNPVALTSFPPLLERDNFFRAQVVHSSIVLNFNNMAKVLENTTALFSKSRTPTQADKQGVLDDEVDAFMDESEEPKLPVQENIKPARKQCACHRSPSSSFIGKNSSRHSPAMVQVTSAPR